MMFLSLVAPMALAVQSASPVEVTVYNQGFGFVKEIRSFDLKDGRQSLSVTDVPELIDPTSVAIKSLTPGQSFDILEQNYQYDLVNAEAILNKAVGQRIRLIRHFGNRAETLEGTLLSSPTAISGGGSGFSSFQYNGMVVKLDDGRIILDPEGEVEVLSIPEGMISVPTLAWEVDATRAGRDEVELSYITQGMTWEANYVLTIEERNGRAALQGWVKLDNNSGATYKNATLKLLAGNVNQVQDRGLNLNNKAIEMEAATAGPMKEEQLFEYHLYTLQRPATVRNKETKQLSLLSADGIPFKKRLIIDALRDYSTYYPSEAEIGGGTQHAQVRVELVDDEKSGLGMPLPAGRFRIYQRDTGGSVQLLGEDRIEHTPRNEKVSLIVGEAFDIVSNRKRLSYRRINSNEVGEGFQIEVRNRKASTETVEVIERHYGDWRITKTSDRYVKADANSMVYTLKLKPNQVHRITYTVVTKW